MASFSYGEIVLCGRWKMYRARFIEAVADSRFRVHMLEGPQEDSIITVPRTYVNKIK